MKRKNLIVLLSLLLFSGGLFAQVELRVLSDEEVEKYTQIVEENGDSSLMRAYQLAIHYKRQINIEQYKKYCSLIIDRTKEDPTNYFSLRALRAMVIVSQQFSDMDSMHYYADRLIEVTENVNDPAVLRFSGMAYHFKATEHLYFTNDYEKAYPLLRKAMEIAEEVEYASDYLNAGYSLCNLIFSSEPQKLPETVEELENTVKDFKNPPEQKYIFRKVQQFKYLYGLRNKNLPPEKRQEALELHRDLIRDYKQDGRRQDWINEISEMLMFFEEEVGQDSVLYYRKTAYDFYKDSEQFQVRASTSYQYASALYKNELYQKAITVFKEVIPLCGIEESSAPVSTDDQLEGDYSMLANTYESLANAYLYLGNIEAAKEYLSKFGDIALQRQTQAVGNAVSDLEVKYDTEKKERENEALLAKNEMIETRSRYLLGIGLVLFSLLGAGVALYLRLQKTKEELERINESKNQLFAIVAHDLKGPVASFTDLSFNVSSLIKLKKYDRLLDLAEYYEKAGRRINYILVNLLDWAISQKDQFVHRPQQLDVQAEVDKVIEELNYFLIQKNVIIENKIEQKVSMMFDKDAFRVIMRNLLHNAVKFSHEDSSVVIDYDEFGLKIKDSGIGMDAATIEKIKKKQRVESQIGTKDEKGNGIGLSTCVKLAEQNDADLKIESSVGEGTVFLLAV